MLAPLSDEALRRGRIQGALPRKRKSNGLKYIKKKKREK